MSISCSRSSIPDFPDERLIACRNPALAVRRAEKRRSLLEATVNELDKVRGMVGRGRLRTTESDRRAGRQGDQQVQDVQTLHA